MRVFFVTDTRDLTGQLLLEVVRKHVKGLIRLGHDTQVFSCNHALSQVRTSWLGRLGKKVARERARRLLVQQIKRYDPDIVHVSFSKLVDAGLVLLMREAAPRAVFLGIDVDLWPELHRNRVEAAAHLDVLFTTYGPNGQESLRQAGVKCVFLPNACDPDIERKYCVPERWRSDIIFTGRLRHKNYPTEQLREDLILRLANWDHAAVYGCCGHDPVVGLQYYYAISGARMALSVNAVNDIQLYHSDRLTQYLACGTAVFSRKVPESEYLFQDGVHLRYFDTVEEFCSLVEQYRKDDVRRAQIAEAGMNWVHQEYNCEKIVQYMLDTVESGSYAAPWTRSPSLNGV